MNPLKRGMFWVKVFAGITLVVTLALLLGADPWILSGAFAGAQLSTGFRFRKSDGITVVKHPPQGLDGHTQEVGVGLRQSWWHRVVRNFRKPKRLVALVGCIVIAFFAALIVPMEWRGTIVGLAVIAGIEIGIPDPWDE